MIQTRLTVKTNPLIKKSFTLIELLVVIVIIAILVALLFPAINAAITRAEVGKSREAIKQLQAAVGAYSIEFGRWPTNTANYIPLTTNLFANTKGLVFYDAKSSEVVTNYPGYLTKPVILDPWKAPYMCKFDDDYDGQVVSPFSGGGNIASGCIIWSFGPDGTNNYSKLENVEVNQDNVRSW